MSFASLRRNFRPLTDLFDPMFFASSFRGGPSAVKPLRRLEFLHFLYVRVENVDSVGDRIGPTDSFVLSGIPPVSAGPVAARAR